MRLLYSVILSAIFFVGVAFQANAQESKEVASSMKWESGTVDFV
jgi:hypothetical protein